MTPDGRIGEPIFVKSEKTIEGSWRQLLKLTCMWSFFLNYTYLFAFAAGLPCCTSLLVSGSLIEGEVMSASYEYTGGQQGISYLNWYLLEVNFYSKLASWDWRYTCRTWDGICVLYELCEPKIIDTDLRCCLNRGIYLWAGRTVIEFDDWIYFMNLYIVLFPVVLFWSFSIPSLPDHKPNSAFINYYITLA